MSTEQANTPSAKSTHSITHSPALIEASDGSDTSTSNGRLARYCLDCLSRISSSTSWMVTARSAMPSSFTPSMIAFASTTSSLSPSLAVKAALLLLSEGFGCALAIDAQDDMMRRRSFCSVVDECCAVRVCAAAAVDDCCCSQALHLVCQSPRIA